MSNRQNYIKIIKENLTGLKGTTVRIIKKWTQSKAWPWCWYSFWALLLIISLFSGLKKSAKGLPDGAHIIIMVIIVSIVRRVRPRLIRKWRYFQEKPSAPYIMLFMILLLFCAFLLIIKLEPVAEQIANIAYFLLVTGVGVEFYQLIKQRKCESTDNADSAEKNKNL
ncbi:hypothetical protein [Candidatus Kuenenia sp.]|uniref:hypothetical protein n=1 Tax=Candidatus Kuenenia sp. TaxID=2499824 RepID=UPI00321FD574